MKENFPVRKRIRLQGYDYSEGNMYFITICVKDRLEMLGEIMPNHIHILLLINYKSNVTISKIIKNFKTNITREIEYSIWQKSFYEHIIRNEKEYLKIKEYIKNNVINWRKDKYF